MMNKSFCDQAASLCEADRVQEIEGLTSKRREQVEPHSQLVTWKVGKKDTMNVRINKTVG